MPGPLAGLKVVELAGLGPVPFCGMMLGDMGAEVVRIDRVEPSDLGIEFPAAFDLRNRNKQSVAIDLKRPEGVAALLRLVARADILIEGFRPGVAERLGFGPEVCFEVRPALVYGRGTGWGQDGPMAMSAGHDINYIALTGALDLIGPIDGAPVVPLNLLGDYAGGAAYLAFGIVCAALEARTSGIGQVVDAAMIDGVTSLLTVFHAIQQSGQLRPQRGSNVLDGGAPFYTTYATKDDRYVAVGAIEPRFYAVLIDRLGLEIDALPAQNDRGNWATLRATLAERFRMKTRDEWSDVFADCPDACFSPVLSLTESVDHPHNRARGAFIDHDGARHPRPAPRLSRTPGSVSRSAPPPGADTEAVLANWGFDRSEIDAGLADGIFRRAQPAKSSRSAR